MTTNTNMSASTWAISEAYQAGIVVGRATAKHEMDELAKLIAAQTGTAQTGIPQSRVGGIEPTDRPSVHSPSTWTGRR